MKLSSGSLLLLSLLTTIYSEHANAAVQNQIVYMYEDETEKKVVLADHAGKTLRTFSSSTEWFLYPDVSADGKYLTYISAPRDFTSPNPNTKVVVHNLKSGETEVFQQSQGFYVHPRFAGNGETLFVSAPLGASQSQSIAYLDLNAVRESSSNKSCVPQTLTCTYQVNFSVVPSEGKNYFPAPSSDSTFVAFQNEVDGKRKILLYNFDSKKTETVSTVDGQTMSPALSFDDRYVAYTAQVEGNWDVYITDLWSKATKRITTSEARDFAPSFKSDGGIIFASDRRGHFELYEISAEAIAAETFAVTEFIASTATLYSPNSSGDLSYEMSQNREMLAPARSSFGTTVLNGKVYAVGGHQGSEHTYPPESFLNNLEVYDVEKNTWTKLAPRPIAAHGYQVVGHGKYIYAFGGFTYSDQHKPKWKSITSIDRYDTETNTWKQVASLNDPRSSNAAVELNGKVYILGGWNSTPKSENDYEGEFLRTIEVFDLKTETVSLSPHELPNPLRRAFSAVASRNELVLVGGLGQGSTHFELLDNVTAFQPETGNFRELAPLPFATFAPAVGQLGGSLYVFGGMFKLSADSYNYVKHIFELPGLEFKSWKHAGRYVKETKGFSQVVNLNESTLGVLGGHTYFFDGTDAPVQTFEVFKK